ncbi:MAG: hypothetical protein Q9202_007100 [Teloschistes flavicans]
MAHAFWCAGGEEGPHRPSPIADPVVATGAGGAGGVGGIGGVGAAAALTGNAKLMFEDSIGEEGNSVAIGEVNVLEVETMVLG